MSSAPLGSDPDPLAPGTILGRMGPLELRLARGDEDIAAAQRLRHRVFVAEGGAAPRGPTADHRERDRFDAACDHLVVANGAEIVGTYRLMLAARAGRTGHYSQGEFDVAALIARHPARRFLELGRSCVHPEWRESRAIRLLWQGAWAYALRSGADVMFGCASFSGTDPAPHAPAFAYLARHAAAPPPWDVAPAPGRHFIALDAGSHAPDRAEGLRYLPALLRGYVRLGGRVASRAVIDPDFGSIDAMVVLPREWIDPRYRRHFGEAADRYV